MQFTPFILLIFSWLLAVNCSSVLHIAKVENRAVKMDTSVMPDTEISAMITPYKSELDAEMNGVIGRCKSPLIKSRPESTLGNWVGDALYKIGSELDDGPIDFAVQNYGGIRTPQLQGEITTGNIFELMPFDNSLVVLDFEADELLHFIQHMAASGGWPGSKHLRYRIDNNRAKDITINGEAIDMNRIYRVALPDYIANGGDSAFFLTDNPRKDLNHLIRDALIILVKESTKRGKLITSELDGRIKN